MLESFLFVLINTGTPGPNNTISMANGLNYGPKASIGWAFGVAAGFSLMISAVLLGLGLVFQWFPGVKLVLLLVSALFLLYIAWKMVSNNGAPSADYKARGFWSAVIFQWLNPKAWFMAISGSSLFGWQVVLWFLLLSPPIVYAWALFGAQMARLLTRPGSLRLFNCVLAAALIGSVLPSFHDAFAEFF